MADPFTPEVPRLGSDQAEADARDGGRRQDPTGALPQGRSFRSQPAPDADVSRDDHQSPLGPDVGQDVAENLGSNG
jgi:hypothetical protein